MKEKEEDKEEILNTKIIFLNEKIDIQLNSEYDSFVKNICNILKIPTDQYSSLKISYNDEDDDNIIVSTEEDYNLYLKQLKEKSVNELILEIREDSNIDPNTCFINALSYQNQIVKEKNKINNENNNMINNNNIIKNNNMVKNNNIINNNNIDNNIPNDIINNNFLNDNMINNEIDNNIDNNCDNGNNNIKNNIDNFNNEINKNYINNNLINNVNYNDNIKYYFDNFNQNNNDKLEKKEPINNNDSIDDKVFDYKCILCSVYPILLCLYYCPNCQLHLCEDCKNKNYYHEHPLQKYISKKELIKIKLKENFNMDNTNDNQIKDNTNKENNNLIKNEVNSDEEFDLLEMIKSNPNPIKLLQNEKTKKFAKKNFDSVKKFFKNIPYGPSFLKAKFQYNLEGVDDNELLEALKQTDGNVDQAIILLTNK